MDDLVMFILYHHHEPQAWYILIVCSGEHKMTDLAPFFFSPQGLAASTIQTIQTEARRVGPILWEKSLPVSPSLASGRRPRIETKRPTGTNEQIDKSALVDAFCQRRELDSWVRNLVGGVEDRICVPF